MAKKQKYYVVWRGKVPGIYDDWRKCEKQIKGVAGAQYKSYESRLEAEAAYHNGYTPTIGTGAPKKERVSILDVGSDGIVRVKEGVTDGPELNSLAVDAACSGNPGVMEYQGVYVATKTQVFHYKAPLGTNNIGEFLGIVHGLSYLKKHNLNLVMYSDSVNAINWVRQKICKSKLPVNAKTQELWDYVHRAEQWLRTNTYSTEIRKWDTDRWGEIPADFGRK